MPYEESVSRLSQLGVALETGAYGTATAAFTKGLLVSAFSANPAQTVEPIAEVRGNLETRRVTKGPIDYSASFNFPLDVGASNSASVGDFLASVYGTDTGAAAGGGKYTHIFSLQNTALPSHLNLWSDKDADNKQYRGFRPASVKFGFNSGEGQSPVDVEGIFQQTSELASQSLNFSDSIPLIVPSNTTLFTVGGQTIDNFESIEITVAREQEAFRALSNSRNVTNLFSGKTFSIAISLGGINFSNEIERDKFLAVTSSSLNLTLTDSNSDYLQFVFPEVYWQTFDGPEISDTDLLRVTATAIVTGDSSNHYIKMQNSYASRYDTGAGI